MCKRGSELGTNPPADARFGRLTNAFRHSACYWGERGEWYIVAAQHRDSESIDRSNFAVLLQKLGGESETVAVERASHWAVGWLEYLIVRPDNRKGLRIAIEAHSSYYDYPLLDESHHSELEFNEAWEFAESELKRFGDGWADAFGRAIEDEGCGYSTDQIWPAIEAAREALENPPPPPEPIDPNQLPLFPL